MTDESLECKTEMKLSRDDLENILSIFNYYLQSFSDEYLEGDLDREVVFIKKFINSICPTVYAANLGEVFINKAKERRLEHIEWLFGADSENGEPEFNMPMNYEEMKNFLINYDILWLGSD